MDQHDSNTTWRFAPANGDAEAALRSSPAYTSLLFQVSPHRNYE
jgi:hypothetical protein